MAPRSLLSVVLAALLVALLSVPASAQEPLRATATRALGDGPVYGPVTSVGLSGGYLAAWGQQGAVQLRPLDAAGAPAGPVQAVSIGNPRNISATELHLVADAAGEADLISVEY